jgi:hypothetical protein
MSFIGAPCSKRVAKLFGQCGAGLHCLVKDPFTMRGTCEVDRFIGAPCSERGAVGQCGDTGLHCLVNRFTKSGTCVEVDHQGGGKRKVAKKVTAKVAKVYTGPRGGKYRLKGGVKVYL